MAGWREMELKLSFSSAYAGALTELGNKTEFHFLKGISLGGKTT